MFLKWFLLINGAKWLQSSILLQDLSIVSSKTYQQWEPFPFIALFPQKQAGLKKKNHIFYNFMVTFGLHTLTGLKL